MKEETKCYCGHTTYCDCGPEGTKPFKDVLLMTEVTLAEFKKNPVPTKKETLEKIAVIAAGLCEHLEAKEQAMFFAGFLECAKWQQEQIGKSEFLQKLRATKSDAEARRLIFEKFKNK